MSRIIKAEDIHNLGSLMTHDINGTETCVGYIFMHEGKAFDPDGRIDGITQQEVDTHNKCLSQASITGLDNNCEIGFGGLFYWNPKTLKVITWVGDLVSDEVTWTQRTVTFRRRGKVMRGRVPPKEDRIDDYPCAVFFKRIS